MAILGPVAAAQAERGRCHKVATMPPTTASIGVIRAAAGTLTALLSPKVTVGSDMIPLNKLSIKTLSIRPQTRSGPQKLRGEAGRSALVLTLAILEYRQD